MEITKSDENVLEENVLEENVLEENVLEENVLEENVLEENVLEENVLEESVPEKNGFLASAIQVQYDALTDEERFMVLGLSAAQGALCTLRGPNGMTLVHVQGSSQLMDSKCDVTAFLIAMGHTFDVAVESDEVMWHRRFVHGVFESSSQTDKSVLLNILAQQVAA